MMRVAETPLTIGDRDVMIGHVLDGATPRADWMTGLEIELIGYHASTLERIGPTTVGKLLHDYSSEQMFEGGVLSGARGTAGSLTVEPGCQIEFSGVPRHTLAEARKDLEGFLEWLGDRAREQGLTFIGIGFDPLRSLDEQRWFAKKRYEVMRPYLASCGQRGLDMMTRTASVQVNVDFESEEDLARKFVVGNRLAPIVGAIFANSPFREGRLSGFKSERALVWLDTDGQRCGIAPPALSDRFSLNEWLDHALNASMFFVRRGDSHYDMTGTTLGEFLSQPPHGFTPVKQDYVDHLTTMFTEARLKQWLELRSADGGGAAESLAIQALWKGLLYDDASLDSAMRVLPALSLLEFRDLQHQIARDGLSAESMGVKVLGAARAVVELARDGLKRLGAGEEGYLDEVWERVGRGLSPADILIANFEGAWHGEMRPVFEHVRVV
jgi:glutamate--cysteine ligase